MGAENAVSRKKSAQQILQSAAMMASAVTKSKRSSTGGSAAPHLTGASIAESVEKSQGSGPTRSTALQYPVNSFSASGSASATRRNVSSVSLAGMNPGGSAGVAGLPHGMRRIGETGERDGRG